MSYDIEYKVGDTDTVGARLMHNGSPVNLTGFTVEFVMKNDAGTRVTVPCSLGGTVDGVLIPASGGGITMHFSPTNGTATASLYTGEYVVSHSETESVRFPSGNNYKTVKIWEAV